MGTVAASLLFFIIHYCEMKSVLSPAIALNKVLAVKKLTVTASRNANCDGNLCFIFLSSASWVTLNLLMVNTFFENKNTFFYLHVPLHIPTVSVQVTVNVQFGLIGNISKKKKLGNASESPTEKKQKVFPSKCN